ncbi:P-loop containing nucleoside triphosphate hydrolase protein [Apiosordaria backusii]|uniref:P-loop containing nucleoside triphosphate hydrolase protein n=1 Tax=Apiosordaria backusii TaxID=314023 RepID=A0AA40EHK8_9PEZI|nr:P-loop containing nucleoside triphosphate hydrolase protein [Apiosordaria backusii]
MLALEDDPMSKLCSEDQLQLLNAVDKLRAQGISNYVSLPQIIVCGDQSSGKSSVLEAISGVSFPIKSNLCTRFPTELILRRTPQRSARVSIVPHDERSESEQKALRGFTQELFDLDDLPELIESAKGAMGISPHGKAFAKDILRVEVTGPDRPHLTMVDLPGLIHSETKNQSASDVQLIQDVVQGYMKQSRCIILAVISAKNDFANQIVLKLARAADPTGNRTLGVITKPDTLTAGSASESLYLALARNQEVEFRLGWHVVKNMDSEKGTWTHSERDAEENKFFSEGIWSELPSSSLGVGTFRGRLSKVLLGQIIAELPSLLNEIDKKFGSCQKQLTSLGDPRASSFDQRHYLFQLAESFQALIKSSISGNYISTFFHPAKTNIGYEQRIRAVVQNLNEEFASNLSNRGHRWDIVDDTASFKTHSATDVGECSVGKVTKVRRSDFISYVEYLQKRTRGRELPGTFNPMLVADLFLEQSGHWEAIAREHIDSVWNGVNRFLELVIAHIADESTAVAMHREVIKPAMKQVLEDMRTKTTELLIPHQNAHPITYNDAFLEVLEQVRIERREKEFSEIIKQALGIDKTFSLTSSRSWILNRQGGYDLGKLAKDLAGAEGMGMKRLAATDAMDCLNSYYKVALRRFIDDISVEVIEEKLVNALDAILSPVSVYHMSPNLAARIAGEPEDSKVERAQLTKQLEVLEAGLETCKRFVGLKLTGGDHRPPSGHCQSSQEIAAVWSDEI